MIKKDFFGNIGERQVYIFTLENSFLKAKILNYGCILQSLIVKEKNIDVVLGYDKASDYQADKNYFGAVVGRTVNCIKNAKLVFQGNQYFLSKNNGEDHLHGGTNGLSKKVWEYQVDQEKLVLTTTCNDGEDGYSGNLQVRVEYSLKANSLCINYSATCDADTPFNVTNHSYFNLNGCGDIFNHYFKFNCIDEKHELSQNGLLKREYDENVYIAGQGLREVSRAYSEQTGIQLAVLSDMPCAQFYTANELEKTIGKREYNRNEGFCVETQVCPKDVIDGKFFLEKNKPIKTETHFVFNKR